MIKSIGIRALIVLAVCLVALFYLTPSVMTDRLPPFWKNNLPADKIHLGLDLQGGMHLVLEVQTDKALEGTIERMANDIKETMMEKKIRFRGIARTQKDSITVEFPDHPAREAFEKIIKDNYPDFEPASASQRDGKEIVQIKLKAKRAQDIKKLAMEQGLETIRNRVDQFGITEPEIIPQGEDRIIVQLPGIRDPGRAKNLIGKTALLEFKLLDEEHSLGEAMRGNIPEGSIIAYGTHLDRESGRRTQVPYLVKNKTLMTGASLETAKVSIADRFGEPYVSLKFNAQGAQDFDRITAENVKKRLAIVLDGVIHSAPVIQERISGGNAQITGTFTMDEAKDLAIVLRAGALPAPVTILEERTVGPSLGQDSIDKGIWSTIAGLMLIVLFMMIYYKISGLVANLALILNIIIIFGTLAAFRATLTLPGIAGIVLGIGMAVDANILILERIREEIRGGKSPRASVEAGYTKAFLAIFDSNLTTLIAALFLFGFGTGPVKGFAVTLTIGLIANMFTAVFVTRIIYDYFIWNRKIQTISV